jgi:predicted ribosome quality control (RQC) complex YloA/Tae2 family protein
MNDFTDDRRGGAPAPRLWIYRLPGGWQVLAGRSDADNDRLSLKLAAPDDLWFHVHGMPGSHVLLRARPGLRPDRETVRRAAAIAAYHSKARDGGTVSVTCTEARNVSKPRGAKPGTVTIRKERRIKVRPDLPPEASAEVPSDP